MYGYFFLANCPYVFKFVLNLIVSFIKADKKLARELKNAYKMTTTTSAYNIDDIINNTHIYVCMYVYIVNSW